MHIRRTKKENFKYLKKLIFKDKSLLPKNTSDREIPTSVLHIITRLIVGGAQENTLYTAELLDSHIYDVDVLSGAQTGSEGRLIENPKAPYFAARDAGQSIDVSLVRQMIEQKRRRFSPLVVEAAGGLLVPVREDLLVIDMIKQIRCRPLLVARAGLGTINHTLLSVEALHSRGQSPMGIVFVDESESPADPGLISENMAAVKKFADCSVSGVISHLRHFDCPPKTAFKPLEKILFRR